MSMAEFLSNYGLFLAKTATVVVAFGLILAMLASVPRRGRRQAGEHLEVTNLNEKYRKLAGALRTAVLPKKAVKRVRKSDKAERKRQDKQRTKPDAPRRKRVFVIDFHGDIRATGVASLREEVSAVLAEAGEGDEVLVRLENAGGLVHEHGLAASQLARVRARQVPLTVAVDKVAASGGYLMACVADRVIAAPFAIVGSIGVLTQLPNFHRLLDQHGVDFEQVKAGEYKRTLTMFGVNTDADRAKVQEQVDDTHQLFKDFVAEYRPALELAKVATGEYWYGRQAVALGLVDELSTSDDYLIRASDEADLYQVKYSIKKRVAERLIGSLQRAAEAVLFNRP